MEMGWGLTVSSMAEYTSLPKGMGTVSVGMVGTYESMVESGRPGGWDVGERINGGNAER